MSSHHVIRENQEPALLVEDFNALDLESLGQILEWSPTIISNEDNLDKFLAEGIKVDVLFSRQEDINFQEHTRLIPIINDYLDDAILYLINHNHKAVNILASYIPTSIQDYASRINIVLFVEGKRYVYVDSSFEKWKPKGELIYIDEKHLKSFQGLEYVSEGIFKTLNDGFIKLEFNDDNYILIGEDL